MAKGPTSRFDHIDDAALALAQGFALSERDRAQLASRLKGCPADAVSTIAERLEQACRDHLVRLVILPDAVRRPAPVPYHRELALFVAEQRERFDHIRDLALALQNALADVSEELDPTGHGPDAKFAIGLAFHEHGAPPGTVAERWAHLWSRAPAALSASINAIDRIALAAEIAPPLPLEVRRKGHILTELVLETRDALTAELPAGSEAGAKHVKSPAAPNGPLCQAMATAIEAMRAAGYDPEGADDLRQTVKRILANFDADNREFDAHLGQKCDPKTCQFCPR